MTSPAVVRFPLRGEWCALQTPAERVPSHGTDYFGQRYAYDFVRSERDRIRFLRHSLLRQLVAVVSASSFYCWGERVFSTFSGRVIAIGDGWPDRLLVNAFWQLSRALLFPPAPAVDDFRPLAGNFVMVQGDVGVAFYAHLRNGSISVREGQSVAEGAPLGEVGNSGNTTMPHLHFHLMDGPDPLSASGLPCAFRDYERFAHGAWVPEINGVPRRLERIRSADREAAAGST